MRNWATYVKKLRERLMLTQEEFGERLGVSRISVYSWERGTQMPRAIHRRALMDLDKEESCKP